MEVKVGGCSLPLKARVTFKITINISSLSLQKLLSDRIKLRGEKLKKILKNRIKK